MKGLVARNVVWNWAGMAGQMVAGFIVAPYLVNTLGDTNYGLWILLASLTGYFGLLDLGMRGSIGRNLAYHRARGDTPAFISLLSTATLLMACAGAIALLGTLIMLGVFPHVFDIPADQQQPVLLALLLVGLNMALSLSLSIFDATLWACQRFDFINAIDLVALTLRVVLTFALVDGNTGLVWLAVITLSTTLLSDAAKGTACFLILGKLGIRPTLANKADVRCLFGYGIWNFLLGMGRIITAQSAPLIIGWRLAVEMITPYALGTRLVGYAMSILSVSAEAITPLATALHAQDRQSHQQSLFIEGGKFSLALSLFFLGGFLSLGESFLHLWIGKELGSAGTLLIILALGETLPMSQGITRSILLGMGKPMVLAILGLVENVVAIILALILAESYGLIGICVGFALPASCFRGLLQILYACRQLDISPTTYVRQAMCPPVLSAILPAAMLAWWVGQHVPTTWPQLLLDAILYSACFLVVSAIPLFGWRWWREGLTLLSRRLWGRRNEPATVAPCSAQPTE